MTALFGTDGIRAVAGEEPLTPATVAKIARAFGERLRMRAARPLVLLGHDGRESADFIGAAISAGLAATGVDVREIGLVTTPGLASIVRDSRADGGAMVSASHNPAHDNGIKLFGAGGEKLRDADERAIEERVAGGGDDLPPPAFGRRRDDASNELRTYLEGLVARSGLSPGELKGWRIAFDGANGGGSRLGPEALRSIGAEVVAIGDAPDGRNINDGVGALHPQTLARAVVANRCALGVALDGDGERSVFVDEAGQMVDGDGVLAACAPDLLARGRLPGEAVVSTVMSNLGLVAHLRERGVRVEVSPVGDRHVVARMKALGLALGAEPSGHVVFGADNHFVGDGIYSALRILELLRRTKEPLSRLGAFERFHQRLVNVPVRSRQPLEGIEAILAARRDAERELGEDGRVVLRYSGTEPLVRVMVEARTLDAASRLADAIAQAVRRSLT
ncbi:MAG TPA: phosphoglucosamine mutase [Planctomycetota bacterium]|nr:phosphoglucosamine mutase [Planctomycetota bacterium]